jgi:hypothetical protein
MHLVIDATRSLLVRIVSFWGKHQMFSEFRVAEKSPNTFYDVPEIKFLLLIAKVELFTLEWRPALQIIVNNVIQFIHGRERKSKSIDDLS